MEKIRELYFLGESAIPKQEAQKNPLFIALNQQIKEAKERANKITCKNDRCITDIIIKSNDIRIMPCCDKSMAIYREISS